MAARNKIALVTGGSRGLGKDAALRIAEKGFDVIIAYRGKRQEAEDVAATISGMGRQSAVVQLDVADIASFDGFIAQLSQLLQDKWGTGQFDFLVNNAGINRPSLIPQTEEAAFDELLNVHFKGVYFLTQKALPLLADNGRIINLSTGLARFVTPGFAAYAAMKGAIEVFTRYLAKELGSRGITANVVAPGIIKTDFTRETFDSHEGFEDMIAGAIALGRAGVPEDIGGVIAFLCTEDARWITAQRIEVSGGMLL
ncbi:SDR family oxidoreductase [uncultured Chitinophaga sp.]|jgi:Dehydrogenases with different specificities (related to short-chain alcohol dehydrogenases)|uniref:SDR family NAD(P)-dependent oxidoreductase n=1 Tax=uncultured Chitinophaga sp. TaxID=339340 RepID=UPI00261E87AC|nr:SDR family oxidoreductase [uncultured Chitinophaga sp.]